MVVVKDLIPNRNIVLLSTTDTVERALQKLDESKITSAPLIGQENKKIYGFVDVVDLLFCLVRAVSKKEISSTAPPSTSLQTDDLGTLAKRSAEFGLSLLADVLATLHPRHDPYYPVREDTSYKDLIDIFLRGVHRVAVTNTSNEVVNVLTQSDVIRHLNQDPTLLGTRGNAEARSIMKPLVSLPGDTKAVDAFFHMHYLGIPSVAIVDSGILSGTLSASDVKAIREFRFNHLLLPVSDFLAEIREKQKKPHNYTVSCSPTSSLKDVLRLFHNQKVHRVFVQDEHKKPLGVISVTDFLQAIYA